MYLGQQQAQQEQAAFPPAIASSSSALSPRRRKLSDSDVGSVAQAMSAAPFPVSGPSLLPQAGSTRPVASSATAAQILEQLIQTSGFDGSMVASPAISAPQAVPAASATHASLLGQVLSQEARGLGRTAAKQDADTQEISKQILQLLHAQQRQQQQLQQQQEQLAQEQQRQLQVKCCIYTQGAEEFCYSLALLWQPYILTYMKDARLQERYRRTRTSHRRRARASQDIANSSAICCTVRSACTTYARKSDRLNSSAPCDLYCAFSIYMPKSALQWSGYPQRTESIYRRFWQPL